MTGWHLILGRAAENNFGLFGSICLDEALRACPGLSLRGSGRDPSLQIHAQPSEGGCTLSHQPWQPEQVKRQELSTI